MKREHIRVGTKAIGLTHFLIILLVWPVCNFAGDYSGGGDGSAEKPFKIKTAADMNEIGANPNDWDAHFVMTADIDLSGYTGTEFNIIGNYSNAFTGVFDGNDHAISNFSYSSMGTDNIGLFGVVSGVNSEVKDLGLIDPNVDAGTGGVMGGIVGYLSTGTLSGCYIKGGRVLGSADFFGSVGGLVGLNRGTVTNCASSCSVSGETLIGGLVGWNEGYVNNCASSSSVSGDTGIGGLVGWNESDIANCASSSSVLGNTDVGGLAGLNYVTIANSFSSGNVEGTTNVGGLIGENLWGALTYCYAAGSVTGTTDVGGLVGYDDNASYTKSFWDSTVNPTLAGIGNTSDPEVIGESTTNMKKEITFTNAGWDFVNIWDICQWSNYPRLIWQIPASDFLCPDGVDFIDYAYFANRWGDINCGDVNDCNGVDLDFSNKVDANDLGIFTNYWLMGK